MNYLKSYIDLSYNTKIKSNINNITNITDQSFNIFQSLLQDTILVKNIYLNDVLDGGETAFQYNRNEEMIHEVKPETGKMLLFPPFWTHFHRGLSPASQTKYVIGYFWQYPTPAKA